MAYGDIGKLDEEDEKVSIEDFDVHHCTLDYDTIFKCYDYALLIATRGNLDREEMKDIFYDVLLEKGSPVEEAEDIVENFNAQ